MDFNEFLKRSHLPEKLKTMEVWQEWIGHFDYYYYRERYGEGDSIIYADNMIMNNLQI